jgi:phospholipid/cholesterol/gamma-HCH transport system ATP-binding protein
MSTAFISCQHLAFRQQQQTIFSDLSLVVPRGQIVAILGPSGTGKTTLLRFLTRQLAFDSGSITFDGLDLATCPRKPWQALQKRMGVVFQHGALFSDLSVFDNVAFPLRLHASLPEALIRNLVLLKLEAVGLRGAADKMPNNLSGGMARRVALARAIALDPELLLADEPFTGQDPISLSVLATLLKTLNRELAMTCLIISHDLTVTLAIADYVYVIANGRVEAEGTPDDIQMTESPIARQFLRGERDGGIPFHHPAKPLAEVFR